MSQWKVKNTFIELDDEEDGYSDDYGLRRSASDSSLSKTSSSSSKPLNLESLPPPRSSPASNQSLPKESRQSLKTISRESRDSSVSPLSAPGEGFEDINNAKNHHVFLSSSGGSSSSKGRGSPKPQNDSSDEANVIETTKPASSSADKKQNDCFEEGDVIDATKPLMYPEDFPLDEAMQVYQKISALVERREDGTPGADIRDVLSTNLAGVDITQYIPVNSETGQLTSLGSVHHLVGSCTPCKFLSKQRCRKGETCLHCHFDHDPVPQVRPHKQYVHYKYRLRLQAKGKLVGYQAGKDGQAISGGKHASRQTYRGQPVPAGTRISL